MQGKLKHSVQPQWINYHIKCIKPLDSSYQGWLEGYQGKFIRRTKNWRDLETEHGWMHNTDMPIPTNHPREILQQAQKLTSTSNPTTKNQINFNNLQLMSAQRVVSNPSDITHCTSEDMCPTSTEGSWLSTCGNKWGLEVWNHSHLNHGGKGRIRTSILDIPYYRFWENRG